VSPYIPLGLISIAFCAVLLLIDKYQDSKKRMEAIKSFPSYAAALGYHLEKAYEIIHKDRMLIYSLEAMRVPDEHFIVFTKDFITLVLKLMGKKMEKEFSYVFGNTETLIFNITEFFNSKYEEDEVRRDSLSAMIESDEVEREVEAEAEAAREQ
jgi:hypothetical protein